MFTLEYGLGMSKKGSFIPGASFSGLHHRETKSKARRVLGVTVTLNSGTETWLLTARKGVHKVSLLVVVSRVEGAVLESHTLTSGNQG